MKNQGLIKPHQDRRAEEQKSRSFLKRAADSGAEEGPPSSASAASSCFRRQKLTRSAPADLCRSATLCRRARGCVWERLQGRLRLLVGDRVYARTNEHTQHAHIYMYVYTHIYTCTYTHTNIHVYTHTYTHIAQTLTSTRISSVCMCVWSIQHTYPTQ